MQVTGAKGKPKHIGSEIARSLLKEVEMPVSSSDDEHHQSEMQKLQQQESADEIQKRISMLKKNISIQRVTSQPPKPTLPPTQSQPAPLPPVVSSEEEDKEEDSIPENPTLGHPRVSSILNESTPFQVIEPKLF